MSEKAPTLTVNEIYESIQGESSWAGLRCVFVRLTFCDLRCTYCDTEYAFYKGEKRPVADVLADLLRFETPLVEITGGEPLLQKNVLPLMTALCDAGRTVLIETSGAHDISKIDPRVHRIMDLKTPGSGECARNLWSNIGHLNKGDEVKCVIGSREDYEWSRDRVLEHDLTARCGTVLFSRSSDGSSLARSWNGSSRTSCPSVFSSRCTSSSGIRNRRACDEGMPWPHFSSFGKAGLRLNERCYASPTDQRFYV